MNYSVSGSHSAVPERMKKDDRLLSIAHVTSPDSSREYREDRAPSACRAWSCSRPRLPGGTGAALRKPTSVVQALRGVDVGCWSVIVRRIPALSSAGRSRAGRPTLAAT